MKLSKRIGNTISALLLTLLVLLVVVVPFSLVLTIAIRQSIELLHFAVGFTQNSSYVDLIRAVLDNPFFKKILTDKEISSFLAYVESEEFRNILISGLRDLLQRGLNIVASIVPAVGSFIFKTFVFLLTLFFILRDGPKFVKFVERFLPMHREDIEQVSITVYKTVLATVYGSIGVGIAQSTVGFIGYKLVGLDYAILLAIATFISSFVPPFGAGFVWFPVALYTFAVKGLYAGAFMFLYGMFVISTIDNFVRPLRMKMGIFLGPIIFTTLFTLALIYEKRILKE